MRRKMILVLSLLALMMFFPRYHSAQALTTHLRIAFNRHQAPYHYLDETGEAIGLHIDMLDSIAQSADFQIEYFPMETGSECLNALERGEVDLVLPVPTVAVQNEGFWDLVVGRGDQLLLLRLGQVFSCDP